MLDLPSAGIALGSVPPSQKRSGLASTTVVRLVDESKLRKVWYWNQEGEFKGRVRVRVLVFPAFPRGDISLSCVYTVADFLC